MDSISKIQVNGTTYDIDRNSYQFLLDGNSLKMGVNNGTKSTIYTPSVMGASGSTHASGLVPDTPSTSGTSKYLREDGTWQTPPDSFQWYGTSSTAADVVQKEVSIPSITSLKAGQLIIVLPTVTSTVADSTLKLNSFDAYPMRYGNAAITTSTDSIVWSANYPSVFVFDGSYWIFLAHGYDSNTTYSAMSVAEGTKGTKTTAMSISAASLKEIIDARGYTTNTGTVTSVAVKMNDTTKGTVTTSGTIDLGTVLTSHQDISGKADKTTTINGHALSSNVTVTKSDVGLGNVGNFKAVSTDASQGLSSTEQSNARANIGAGTSSFSGSYDDLSNKPTIPAAQVQSDWNATTGMGVILNKPSSLPANGGNAATVGGFTVGKNVPSNAVFTDTTYTAGTGINISNGLISVDNSVYTTSNAPTYTNTTYSLTINGTTNGDSNGTSLGTLYAPTTTGTSGQVWKSNGSGGEWGTVSASVSYPNVTYTVTTKTNSSSSITDLDATVADVCIITTSANITSLSFSAGKAPAIGHSYHVIIKSNGTTKRTVAVSAGRVSDSNVTGNYMYYICPTTSGISGETTWVSTLSTNATSCSYAEIDFLRVDETTIYVRGV